MGKLIFSVEIEFDGEINQSSEIKEVGNNIALALVGYANNEGLAPSIGETFTKQVSVFNNKGLICTENIY